MAKLNVVSENLVICEFQGARFMSTAMYDAREALIPGSAYDRSSAGIHVFLFCILSCDNNSNSKHFYKWAVLNFSKPRLGISCFLNTRSGFCFSWTSIQHVLSNP